MGILRAAARVLPLLIATQAMAQITPITVPKGKLRWDFGGQFESYDYRWRDGTREEAVGALRTEKLGAPAIPGLADLNARLQKITGATEVDLSLGRSLSSQIVNLGTRRLGGAVGLTKRITLFGNVPFVSVKIEPRFLLDTAGSTLGVSQGSAQYATFLSQLNSAVAALQARISSGAFNDDPASKALAQSRVAYGQTLFAELSAVASQAAFLPTASSAVGTLLLSQIQSFRTDLASLGVTSFSAGFSLPTKRADLADFDTFLTDPNGSIQAQSLDDTPYLTRLGDIEVGAAFLLFDRFPATRIGFGTRATLDATVRLRTGQLDRQDRFLDLGTGDRQPDVDVNLTTDFAFGRAGLRLVGGYNLQLPGNQDRRVARPDQPIAPISARAGVRRDPGDVIRVSARPFLRLATYLSVFGAVDYWNRRTDKFTYAAGQDPIAGLDLNDLAIGTKSDALLLSGGLSYSHGGESKRGILKLPLDASFVYQRIATSRTGLVPDISMVRIDLRFYSRLWN